MQGQRLTWKEQLAPRAKHIAPKEWERHRKLLTDLYNQMTLADLMSCMQNDHNFSATRRQYVHHLQVWGLQKYKKRTWSAANAEASRSNQTHVPFDDVATRQEADQLLDASDSRALNLPRNETLGQVADISSNLEAIRTDEERDSSKRAGSERDFDDSSDSGASVSGLRDASAWIDQITSGELDSTEEASSVREQSLASGTSDPATGSVLPFLGLHSSVPDVDSICAAVTLSLVEMEEIKQAAEFLFATHDFDDAFALYLKIIDHPGMSIEYIYRVTRTATLGCPCCAIQSPHSQTVRHLVDGKLAKTSDFALDVFESFSHWFRDPGEFQWRLGKLLERAEGGNLRLLPETNRTLDLVALHYLRRKIQNHGLCSSIQDLKTLFLHAKPGPLEMVDRKMQNPTLRGCLRWCIMLLGRIDLVGMTSTNLRNMHKESRHRIEFINIFRNLWQALYYEEWIGPARKSKDVDSSWFNTVQETMGISRSEMLAVLCTMILNTCESNQSSEFLESGAQGHEYSSGQQSYAVEVENRVLRGAQSLDRLGDDNLGMAFLDAYIDTFTRCPADSFAEDPSITSYVRLHVRAYVQDLLKIRLPSINIGEKDPRVAQAIITSGTSSSEMSGASSSSISAIAPSLDSSDYSSFRRLGQRIAGDVTEAMTELSLDLPSNVDEDDPLEF